MQLKDFYYDLPKELIAQHPLTCRDMSRLLVMGKDNGNITHTCFKNITDYLHKGDCLVLNDTRVIPARLYGVRDDTGGKIEFVLLHPLGNDLWEVILKPGRRAKVGTKFIFGDALTAEILEIKDDGSRIVKLSYNGNFNEILNKIGEMPLPPYITEKLEDNERYQTVYSNESGSAAAPTAGLHFTKELLDKIKKMGVSIAYVTLHVGLGTFRQVKTDVIEEHKMHAEYFSVNEESANIINQAKEKGGRIFAGGTTSCRTIESIADESGKVSAKSGWTDIFIYPGYKFKTVDCLITNFHLPETTLLMLVSSLSSREHVLNAYKSAINERYRFFSFGDAMLII